MQTVLKQIITKFNNEFDKQKFLDWFNNSKESWLVEEKQQLENAFKAGVVSLGNQDLNINYKQNLPVVKVNEYYSQTFKND
jgi:hypothetical protein